MSGFTKENITDTKDASERALHLSVQINETQIIGVVIEGGTALKKLDEFSFIGSSIENRTFWLNNLLQTNKLFAGKFQSVDVAFMGERSLLIPTALYEENLKRAYLELFFEWDKEEEILFKDYMVSLKSMNLYACPRYISDTFKEIFPIAQFRHFSSVLIEHLLRLNKSNKEKVVYIHIYPKRMDVVILEGYKLIFHNAFQDQTIDGWLYYILFITEQLEIDLNQTQFIFIGSIEKHSEEWNLLKSYLPKANFMAPTYILKRSDEVDDFPEHRYHILVNQAQCV